jgi:SAM-dependent methyltransferase
LSSPSTEVLRDIASQYAAGLAVFNDTMRAKGFADIERYYWYHTVALGNGLPPTPGMYDFRETIDAFAFDPDLRGRSVLDVGSATGYFAFEFERRGADVVSVELPSLEQLDRFPGQETSSLLARIEHMIVPHSEDILSGLKHRYSAQQLHHYLLEGPFRLCARLLHSRVERRYCPVYDLSAERLGRPSFDLVFLGDILVHTLNPFNALAAAAKMCRETLYIAQMMPGEPDDRPAMIYEGGADPDRDDICWWLPNEQCFIQMLHKLGFSDVRKVGTHEGLLRPGGHPFVRRVIRADR